MVKFLKANRIFLLIGFISFGLFLFLRLYNLTILPVFADEAIYIRWAQIMRAEPTLRFLPLSDGKQPLFMWTVIPMLKLFQDPLVSGRTVSILAGLATLIGTYILTFSLFRSKRIAALAGFLYAVSPYAVFFDRIGLVDSLLAMFGVWALTFSVLAVKTKRLDYAMITGFFLGGALLTKSPAIFFSLLLPFSLILTELPKIHKSRHLFKTLLLFVPIYLIAYGMYNILRLGPNFHLVALRNKDYVLPLSHFWENPKDPFIFHIDRVLEWFWQLGPSIVVIFFGLGLITGLKRKSRAVLVLSLWVFLPVLIQSMFAKSFTTRYVLFSLPYSLIIAASIFLEKGRLARRFLNYGLIFFLFHSFYINNLLLTNPEEAPLPRVMRSGYLEEWTSGTGIREAADIIKEEYRINPEKKIVVGTEGYFGTLPDGLQMYMADLPEVTVIGVGLGIKEVPSQLVDSKAAGNKTYFVINSSRLEEDPEKLNLSLVAAYPKAFRPEGLKEWVVHGPRETLYLFEVK